MAEQRDDKPKFPIAGLLALLGMISGLLFYEGISLKTSRPVDREKATNIFLKKGIVQSRLWQDPFEAIDAHRALEQKLTGKAEEKNDQHSIGKLVEVIEQSDVSDLRILPVFVDGSPYVNGAESRLNDRYAVVSALGAAGYVPESGEYIRFFKWRTNQAVVQESSQEKKGAAPKVAVDEIESLVPAELYFPKADLRGLRNGKPVGKPAGKPVLVLWLKEQDADSKPLMFLNDLFSYLKKSFSAAKPHVNLSYDVLGPHSSATLSAMLKELQAAQSDTGHRPFDALTQARFFSPWATAEDTFLLDRPPEREASPDKGFSKQQKGSDKKTIDELLSAGGIRFTRTIGTDAVLAAQLLQELERRQVDLKPCMDKHCNPKVALISEWDTLYGRALPRTFAAVAMNEDREGRGETGPKLEVEINKLRRDEWPEWIYRHSYLAGLDGELPAAAGDSSDSKDKESSQSKAMGLLSGQVQNKARAVPPRPEGRAQLDYVVRLAAALKQEETRNGEEFKAIGVLGSDVYDKLLILQALRHSFPRAIFFTTDLNARLSYPAEWQWTRNLIVASHFGLELQPDLQQPIPPFRDSYQTSLFYSALRAIDHFVPIDSASCQGCFRVNHGTSEGGMRGSPEPGLLFSSAANPRLYEIGRHGAFDISVDVHPHDQDYASIQPQRPDLETYADTPRSLKLALGTSATVLILVLGMMLISNTAATAVFRLTSNLWFWLFLVLTGVGVYGAVIWVKRSTADLSENEPLVLTEGISAWPTAVIGLLGLLVSMVFLAYSWRKLKDNEKMLTSKFGLEDFSEATPPENKSPGSRPLGHSLPFANFQRALKYLMGLAVWHSPITGHVDAVQLWDEYKALGTLENVVIRCLPQAVVALGFAGLMMALFGLPNIPCRGPACFTVNEFVLLSGVTALVLLICYVVDVTLLCRRWVNCIAANQMQWPQRTLERISGEQGVSKENLDEWLGIELIAERTKVIGNFIYFPFIAMFVLVIARYPYLDNWDFPAPLVLIFALNALLLIGNALALRHSAETARREAIKRLEGRLSNISPQGPEEIKQRQRIEWAIDEIRKNQKGAFLPFTQHPIFGAAIALPSGGYGLVLLLEYLATGF